MNIKSVALEIDGVKILDPEDWVRISLAGVSDTGDIDKETLQHMTLLNHHLKGIETKAPKHLALDINTRAQTIAITLWDVGDSRCITHQKSDLYDFMRPEVLQSAVLLAEVSQRFNEANLSADDDVTLVNMGQSAGHNGLAHEIKRSLDRHNIDIDVPSAYCLAGVIRGYYLHRNLPAPQPPAADGQDDTLSAG